MDVTGHMTSIVYIKGGCYHGDSFHQRWRHSSRAGPGSEVLGQVGGTVGGLLRFQSTGCRLFGRVISREGDEKVDTCCSVSGFPDGCLGFR